MGENFRNPKDLYNFFNGRYFRGRLPNIPVTFSKKRYSSSRNSLLMGSTWFDGITGRPVSITLNPRFRRQYKMWHSTLLHEMVHVEQWKVPAKQAHGRKFRKRMRQLAAIGAYDPFW